LRNRFVNPLLIATAIASFTSPVATAGVVGSGTPASCTEAALSTQIQAGGTVTFNCGAGPQTIPFIFTMAIGPSNPKVTIDGNDAITLDGTGFTSGMVSIFGDATSLPDVTFKHITFANGNITSGLIAGGAIQNFGKLTLDTVVVRNSHADGNGAIFQEPCIGCLGPSLTVTHSLFQNNSTGGGGSAITVEGGNATVSDSTFTGNSGPSGGAIYIYGNSTFKISMSIDRCTFNGNVATPYAGGAIAIVLLNAGSTVSITNDTFTANTATGGAFGQGAAIFIGGAPVTITNCTIAGNSAASSGGAVYFGNRTPATIVNNTIIASNSGGNCMFEPGGTFTGGHNVQYGDSTCLLMTTANPELGSLADNGGSVRTMALGAGSPAIDAADPAKAPATDARGVARTDGNGDGIVVADIGSFEASTATTNTNPLGRHHSVRP
jgi:predicted outer membrane repeat protein